MYSNTGIEIQHSVAESDQRRVGDVESTEGALPALLQTLDPEIYLGDNYVVLDFEIDTSHGDYGSAVHSDNGLLLACWKRAGEREGLESQWGSEFQMDRLLEDIQEADFVVAHHAKYELMWLARCGLDLSTVLVFDTQISEYVLLGNLAAGDDKGLVPRSTSLDACCRRRGWRPKDPVVDIYMKNGHNPVTIPALWLEQRCKLDVISTERLFLDQREHLHRTKRLPVQYTRCMLTPVLASTEFVGMHLDADRVEETYQEYTGKLGELQGEMDRLTGGINWRSRPQVADFLYDELGFAELRRRNGEPIRTEKGARKTDKYTLEKLKAKTPEQKHFVRLRKDIGSVADALSKNLEFFKGVIGELNSVFRAIFNQTNTATHRLSSNGIPTLFGLFDRAKTVQFQNLPRVFKRLFSARNEGWKIGEADGSQLEFRVAAHLGSCEAAKELIVTGGDVHELSTCIQFDLNKEEAQSLKEEAPSKYKKWRTASKSWTFQPLYGGEGRTKKQQEYADAFRKAYPGISKAQKSWVNEVINTKRLITPWGLQYYWPNAYLRKDGKLNVKNSVYNYPVQALATAEIIPIAVVFFWHRVQAEGLQDKILLVNTVHDSLIAEIHPDHVDDFRRISISALTHDVYRYLEEVYDIKFDFVPLGVGITVGDHWNEGKEESYNVYYDGRIE